MKELRTEKYKLHVLLFFIYICSPLFGVMIFSNLEKGNELVDYALLIFFVIDSF